jgi:glycosyltransferase involved in cell wall biosynthesis
VRLLGARRSLLTLVKHLHGTHVQPLILVYSRGPLTDEFDRLRIPYEVLKLSPWRKAASWLRIPAQLLALRELISREKIDLIHCNEIYPNPHAIVAAGQGSVPGELLTRLVHARALHSMRIPVVTHMRLSVTPRMVKNYHLHESTRIIAVSDGAARDFDPFPWKQERVRVVHNGIDFEDFEDARARRDAVRAQLGFAPGDFVIGQFGLMMPRKRPRFLLDAAPDILHRVPHARFLFIGDASPGQQSYLDELKQLAQSYQIEHAVRFLPFQTQIADYFGALDLNMLVSDDEGFGRVIIEAAAAGVPTVGSRVGGIPELIVDNETGFLLGEPEASNESFWREIPRFVEIVAHLATDPDTYAAVVQHARARAHERFSSKQYVSNVVSVFHEALQEFRDREDPW